MLHKLSMKTLDFLIKGSTFFDTHPIRWNKDKTKLVATTSKFTLFRWKFQLSLIFMYEAFILYRLYDSLVNEKLTAAQCVIQLFYAISYFYYCSNNYNYYTRKDEIAGFGTLFLNFDKVFPAKPHQVLSNKRFAQNLMAFLAAGLGNGMFQGPCFLYFSKNRNFLYTAVEPYLDPSMKFWMKFPFALLEMWISTLSWCGSLFNTFIWFAIANCIPKWSEAMSYNEAKKLARPMKRTTYFRSLQCLMIQFNDCYAWHSFLGVKISAFFGLIIVLYGSLRFYGKIPIVGYAVLPLSVFMGFLYAFLMFPAAGHASDALDEMLNGWSKIGLHFLDRKEREVGFKRRSTNAQNALGSPVRLKEENGSSSVMINVASLNEQPEPGSPRASGLQVPRRTNRFKLNTSFIKSCPIVGFRVGGFYCVQTSTTFTFRDMVINQTINCMLSF